MGVGLFIKKGRMSMITSFWFKPADANEKYIAIMGQIDCWLYGDKIDCQDKNYFWIT